MQLRFTSLTVTSSREDLHLQECAHAGRTKGKSRKPALFEWSLIGLTFLPSGRSPGTHPTQSSERQANEGQGARFGDIGAGT